MDHERDATETTQSQTMRPSLSLSLKVLSTPPIISLSWH